MVSLRCHSLVAELSCFAAMSGRSKAISDRNDRPLSSVVSRVDDIAPGDDTRPRECRAVGAARSGAACSCNCRDDNLGKRRELVKSQFVDILLGQLSLRCGRVMDFHVSLVGRKDLSGEIYRQVRRAIVDRRLRPGDRLPSSRELARALVVARATVTVAYERLAAEGFVEVRQGAGTFVGELVTQPGRDKATHGSSGVLQPRRIWQSVGLPTVVRGTSAVRFSHWALRRFAVSRRGMATGSDSGTAFERDDRRHLRAPRRASRSQGGDRPAHWDLPRRRGFGGRHHHHERDAAGARSSGARPAGARRRDCRRRSGLRSSKRDVQDVGISSDRRACGSRRANR